jgi:diguanylate cyclase (GGDEF)-like protein/putative nucleotidyltransferase with HDIG domain
VRRLSFVALEVSDARGIYRALAEELLAGFDVDQVHVSRLAQDASISRGSMFRAGSDGRPEIELDYVLSMQERSAVRRVVETGKPFNVSNARESKIVNQELVERFDVASALFTPISFDGEVRSVIVLVSETPHEFTRDEVELVYTMANQAAAGLAVLETRERISAQAEQQTALARAAQALNARLDLRAVLDTLCHEADLALGGDLAGVYLGDARNGGVGVAAHGLSDDSDWFGYVIRPGEGVGGQVLVTGEPAISNAYQREVELPEPKDLQGIETAVSVPVRWNGELKGALSVAFYSMRRVSEQDIGALQAIADLAAVACSNAEAFEQAQTAARTDSLTGFLNHGAVQVRIREEIWRARRAGTPLSCLLVDLDNFKPINDRHGHLVGDEILQQIATAIASEFRPYDGIARFGGDEFVLVLPGTDEDVARDAAERLRKLVCDIGSGHGEMGVPITASVGIAQWREPLTAGELLDRADRALLLAKQRGKDGLAVAGVQTERELAELDLQAGASPSAVVTGLWDMISQCEGLDDVIRTLPSFIRRALDLQEVALYEPAGHKPGGAVRRVTVARAPGDPGQIAFRQPTLTIGSALLTRLESGAISRSSLSALKRALELPPEESGGESPAGSCAALALARSDRLFGVLLLRSDAPEFPLPTLRLAELLAGQAVTALLGQAGDSSPAAVAALAAAIDARDNYTHVHSEQVVALATEVARRLGLSEREVDQVRDGAMLHDVGKVAIPNEILYKPGPLTDSEWEIMREHPVIGERILRRTPELREIALLVRHEHERWDGGGYPDGLAGAAIPIGSRIIFACDAYSAMITERPYREPMSSSDAQAELRGGAGSQFDPEVIEVLLRVLAEREALVGA